MRLHAVLDALHVLSSFWRPLAGPQVCLSEGARLPIAVREAPTQIAVTAYINVNVVPMDTERVLLDQTVVIKGDHITAMGPASQVEVPAEAVRIDGRGKYLMPGLVDMHGHSRGPTPLRHAITAYRTVGTPEVDSDPEPRPYQYKSAMLQAFGLSKRSPKAVAAAYRAAGNTFISVSSSSLQGLDAVLAVARAGRLPLAVHSNDASSLGEMLQLNYHGSSIEHVYSFIERRGSVVDTVPDFSARVEAMRRAGIWVTATLGCHESYGVEGFHVARMIIKKLHDAGAGLFLGPDNGADMHTELVAMVGAGLTPYQVLVIGTRNPAEYFGLLDSVGTVAVGKWADLVLLEGNPLEDIFQMVDPAGVMVRGRWVPREGLNPQGWSKRHGYWPSMLKEVAKHAGRQIMNSSLTFKHSVAEAFTDSLMATSRAPAGRERVMRLVALRLGEVRALQSADQQVEFDERARQWLRERKQDGYDLTIPGVQP